MNKHVIECNCNRHKRGVGLVRANNGEWHEMSCEVIKADMREDGD